jgi:hypothetical protein
MQNFHQSTWDHEILHGERSSKGEQLLKRLIAKKKKKTLMWRAVEI